MTLEQAYQVCPGLEEFCHTLWQNFSPRFALPDLERRASAMVARLPADLVHHELAQWQLEEVVPSPDPARAELVGMIWQSSLFQVLMGAIGFFPPADIDLTRYLPRPPRNLQELTQTRLALHQRAAQGAMARGEMAYWQMALHLQAPNLYLEPFLPAGPLHGCDLACGWGRICLALSEYSERRIQACDLAAPSLRRLGRMAERMGLAESIIPCRADITKLPFSENEFDFFLAFDIFEHLVDPILDACLEETLRCGKVGAVLYAEIPLQAFCPPLTHVQNWTQSEVQARLEGLEAHGKRWRQVMWSAFVPEHFTFQIEEVPR